MPASCPKPWPPRISLFYGTIRQARSSANRTRGAIAAIKRRLGSRWPLYTQRFFPPGSESQGAGHGRRSHRAIAPAFPISPGFATGQKKKRAPNLRRSDRLGYRYMDRLFAARIVRGDPRNVRRTEAFNRSRNSAKLKQRRSRRVENRSANRRPVILFTPNTETFSWILQPALFDYQGERF